MRRAFLLLVLATASATAAPRTLTMKREEASNLHLAQGRGAINRRSEVTVTITLAPKGKLAVTAIGTDRDHDLYVDGGASRNTEIATAWTSTWSGTWAERGSELVLQLVLGKHACSKQRTSDGFAPETLACGTPSKRATVTCAAEEIDVEDAAAGSRRAPAWRCDVSSGALAETPSQWVLGRRACILTRGGKMMRDSFAPC